MILKKLLEYAMQDVDWEFGALTWREQEIVRCQDNLDRVREVPEHVRALVDYCWKDEIRSYCETFDVEPDDAVEHALEHRPNHIFVSLAVLIRVS